MDDTLTASELEELEEAHLADVTYDRAFLVLVRRIGELEKKFNAKLPE